MHQTWKPTDFVVAILFMCDYLVGSGTANAATMTHLMAAASPSGFVASINVETHIVHWRHSSNAFLSLSRFSCTFALFVVVVESAGNEWPEWSKVHADTRAHCAHAPNEKTETRIRNNKWWITCWLVCCSYKKCHMNCIRRMSSWTRGYVASGLGSHKTDFSVNIELNQNKW